jgi:hypothetical protein
MYTSTNSATQYSYPVILPQFRNEQRNREFAYYCNAPVVRRSRKYDRKLVTTQCRPLWVLSLIVPTTHELDIVQIRFTISCAETKVLTRFT